MMANALSLSSCVFTLFMYIYINKSRFLVDIQLNDGQCIESFFVFLHSPTGMTAHRLADTITVPILATPSVEGGSLGATQRTRSSRKILAVFQIAVSRVYIGFDIYSTQHLLGITI